MVTLTMPDGAFGTGRQKGVSLVLASSALLPLFAPIEVDGSLLADGCLGANTMLDLVLDGDPEGARCSRIGPPPLARWHARDCS